MKCGEFLTGSATISFTKSTPLEGVNQVYGQSGNVK